MLGVNVLIQPESDQSSALPNHLVRPRHERLRNVEAERLGSLKIYHQLELSGLLHRQVAGLRAFQDFGHGSGGSPEHILQVRPIGYQATVDSKLPRPGHSWKAALFGELYHSFT